MHSACTTGYFPGSHRWTAIQSHRQGETEWLRLYRRKKQRLRCEDRDLPCFFFGQKLLLQALEKLRSFPKVSRGTPTGLCEFLQEAGMGRLRTHLVVVGHLDIPPVNIGHLTSSDYGIDAQSPTKQASSPKLFFFPLPLWRTNHSELEVFV